MGGRDRTDQELVTAVRDALEAAADPSRAPAMQAYMKSTLPFRGVAKPERTSALRPVWAAHPVTDPEVWEATVRALHDEAAYREERYAALALLARGRRWHDTGCVPLVEHLVVTGAWWDLVDEVAGRTVAPMLRARRPEIEPVVRRWSTSDDLWLRRVSVLSQLGRGEVDHALLGDVVLSAAPSEDFFLSKAVGWALRDHAHRDPDWVRAFLAEHGDRLSPLSRREASKHL